VTVLAGGVGAARFLQGLCRRIDPRQVTIVGNTGDDEEVFGLHIAPDLDTVVYTLAGRAGPHGWGLAGDSFACLEALRGLGEPTWFQLGDRDVALNLVRTAALRRGETLTAVTARLVRAHGLGVTLLPMTNARVRTFVHTERGRLPFQTYLVRYQGRGRVRRIECAGAATARPGPGVLAAIRDAQAVIVAPSNPLVSIGPMLAMPGVRRALRARRAPAAAISPLVGGRPLKGPLHRMLRGLGLEVSPRGVAQLYAGLIDVFVLDRTDAAWAPAVAALGIRPVVTDTIMRTPAHAARLAGAVLRALEPGAS
jgi:LPPG:FO 2-phospho-L-lactate transferase